MKIALAGVYVLLAGCSDAYDVMFGPSLAEVATECGVSQADLKQAKKEVAGLRPYQSRKLGKCDLIVDDSRHVSVVTIEPPAEANK